MKRKEHEVTSEDILSNYLAKKFEDVELYPVRGIIHFKQKYAFEDKYDDEIEYFEIIDPFNICWLSDFCEGQTDVIINSVFTIEYLIDIAEYKIGGINNAKNETT